MFVSVISSTVHLDPVHEVNEMAKVALWGTPRSLSTAFERSIRELEDVKVFHEPYQATYLNQSGADIVSKVASTLVGDCSHQAVFFKDHSEHVTDYLDILCDGPLVEFKHTFLIRHPAKVLSSLHKFSKTPPRKFVIAKRASVHPLYTMYTFVQQKLDPCPVVVDADDLLCDPEGIMKKYCAATGLPFKDGMTKWEPRMFPDWEKCPHNGAWHHDIAKSSGFVQQAHPSSPPPVDDLPEDFRVVVDESLPLYEALYRVRMK